MPIIKIVIIPKEEIIPIKKIQIINKKQYVVFIKISEENFTIIHKKHNDFMWIIEEKRHNRYNEECVDTDREGDWV